MNTLPMALFFTNAQYAIITLVIYSLLLLYGLLNGKTIKLKTLIFFGLVSFLITISSISNGDASILYGVLLLELYKAIVVSVFLDFEQFSKIYIKTVFVLAFVSLVFHLLLLMIPSAQQFGILAFNENRIPFYSFVVYFKSTNEPFRNYGFLTEPGDYQHYLNTALLLYLFSPLKTKEKFPKITPIVLSIAAITTFSPAGLVYLGCVWAAYLFHDRSFKKSSLKVALALLLAVVIVMISPLYELISSYTIAKLTGASTNSRGIRLDGILVGLKYFAEKPFFGYGCTKAITYMSNDLMLKYGGSDQTSTITGYLAMFGLFTTFLLVWSFFDCLVNCCGKKISFLSKFFIFAGLMMTLNNERFIWELTYYIFVIYGLTMVGKKKEVHARNAATIIA